jgi:hypothetical protein
MENELFDANDINQNNLKTPEEFAKLQKSLDERNDKLKADLPEDEQAKFEAVQAALDLLAEANVPCFLLPMLPDLFRFNEIGDDASRVEKLLKYQVYQYNNFSYFMQKVDGENSFTPQSKLKMCFLNRQYMTAFFFHLRNTMMPPDAQIESVLPTLVSLFNESALWFGKGEVPEEVLKFIEKYNIND